MKSTYHNRKLAIFVLLALCLISGWRSAGLPSVRAQTLGVQVVPPTMKRLLSTSSPATGDSLGVRAFGAAIIEVTGDAAGFTIVIDSNATQGPTTTDVVNYAGYVQSSSITANGKYFVAAAGIESLTPRVTAIASGTVAVWARVIPSVARARPEAAGGGGGVASVSGTSPIASSGGATPAISIANAGANGSTKGAASFNASDFDSTSGNISIDYTNGQAADATHKGFLPAADWAAFDAKQAALGFTPENSANKDATGGYAGLTLFKIDFKNAANTFTSFFTNSNTAARTYTFQNRNGTIADDTDLAGKQNSLGFTAENVANKRTAFQVTPDDTHYASEKLVKDSLDAKQASLGFTAENSANKVTAFSTPTDVQYPSAKLVSDQLALKASLTSPNFSTGITIGGGNAITSFGTGGALGTGAFQPTGATRAMDNLATVAINSALLPGTDASIDLGSASGPLKRWSHVYLSAFVGIVSAGGNVNEIFYSDGIGPKFWDETVSHHMVFNVQSITNDRTYTWPNSSGSVVTAPTAGPVTIAGPTAPRTVTFPNAAFTAARTDAAQNFIGTNTFDSVSTPSIVTASGDLTITPGSSGNILSTRPIILQVGGQCFLAGGTDPNTYKIGITDSGGGVLRGSSTALIAFSNDSANANGTLVSGISQISNGLLAIGNGSQGDFTGTLKLTNLIAVGHLIGGSATPTIANGAGAGTSPGTPAIAGTDIAGQITIITGTLPSVSATAVTVTFNAAYGTAPYVVIWPANAAAATLGFLPFVGSTTTTFTVNAGTIALGAATTYLYNFVVVGGP